MWRINFYDAAGGRPKPDPNPVSARTIIRRDGDVIAVPEGRMLDPVPHLKAAFSTDSLTWVDADFAWARHLVVYDLTPSGAELVEALAYGPRCHAPAGDTAGDQMAAKLGLLRGRGVLFSTGLSERTAMTLSQAGIFPVVLEQRRPIQDVLTRLQKLMHRDPPLWMCRVLRYGACRHDHF